MPSLGADMDAGTLVRHRKAPGEPIARGDIVAEVETEKGLIEVEAFTSGVLERWLVAEGAKVPVGTPLATIAETAATEKIATNAETAASAEPAREASNAPGSIAYAGSEIEYGVHGATPSARKLARESGVDLEALRGTGKHGVVTRGDVLGAGPPGETGSPRARISPAARRRAREAGVDLAELASSGVVHLADVERIAAERARSATEARAPDRTGMRDAIARAMSRSKREIPHYYVATTIDLGPALAWLGAANEQRSVAERIVPAVLPLKAIALALRAVPELNGRYERGFVRSDRVHLGVAIHLRGGGLVAPAIHDFDRLSVGDAMAALADLSERARAGRLRSSEMSDGTITVTSLGERGVEEVLPVIVPPQVAMVGLGKIVERPWVVGGSLAVRPVLRATLAADHRVTDGHLGARFLAKLAELLTTPEAL